MLAPAKTPPAVVGRLNREIRADPRHRRGAARPASIRAWTRRAASPSEFAALIKADMEKWGEIGRRLGVKLD